MEDIVGELSLLNCKRRTTYKKFTDDGIEDDSISVAPSVLGKGFLFENPTLNRVRDRLEGKAYIAGQDNSSLLMSQTQVISTLYDGGEDLEVEKSTHDAQIPSTDLNATQRINSNINDAMTQRDHVSGSSTYKHNVSRQEIVTQKLPISDRNSQEALFSIPAKTLDHAQEVSPTYQDGRTQNSPIIHHAEGSGTLRIHLIEQKLRRQAAKDEENGQTVTYKPATEYLQKMQLSKENFLENFDDSSCTDGEEDENIRHITASSVEGSSLSKKEGTTMKYSASSKRGALKNYEHELKRESNFQECIVLSSEDDETDDKEPSFPNSFASKASLLELRAKICKKKISMKKAGNETSLKKLFTGLREAAQNQILEQQRQLMEQRGVSIEDMENEKQIVEDLLEQEIARNRKIRINERKKEKNSTIEAYDGDVNYADDESSNVSTQDDYESTEEVPINVPLVEHFNDAPTGGTIEGNEIQDTEESEVEPQKKCYITDEDEDKDITITRSSAKKGPIITSSNSDSDSEDNPYTNGIDLGKYGKNLAENHANDYKYKTGVLEECSDSESDDYEHSRVIAEAQARRKQEENKNRERRRDMKKSGMTKMFEIEAEESEDEWHGLGGADGEQSEEYDSEVEKMIDDYSRTNVDADEIRNMLAKENKELDLKMVNKILHDIKNGGFRKRRRTGMMLEISDDEDEILENYRSKRRELMRKKRLQVTEESKIFIKDGKTQAFFESMMEDMMDQKKLFDIDNKKHERESSDSKSTQEVETTEKRKVILSEEFVQESLSFLKNNERGEETKLGMGGQAPNKDERVSDIFSLKKDSFVKTLHTPFSSNARFITEDHGDEVNDILSSSRTPSVSSKFGSRIGIDDKLKDGKKTVTVSRSYKTVGGNRASVTYLGKMRRLAPPKQKKASAISNNFRASKSTINSIFENNDDSFAS